MGMTHNVPVQSLIDHIKTAIDVDPWAQEMVENLLKEQPEVVRCKECKHGEKVSTLKYYPDVTWCNKHSKSHNDDWFCADGVHKEGR